VYTAAFMILVGVGLVAFRRRLGKFFVQQNRMFGINASEPVARAGETMAVLVGVFLVLVGVLKAVGRY
jgi:hypothetical protein